MYLCSNLLSDGAAAHLAHGVGRAGRADGEHAVLHSIYL